MSTTLQKNAVFVHIVTFNSAPWIARCLDAVFAQTLATSKGNLTITVTDNNSSDATNIVLEKLQSQKPLQQFSIVRNEVNIGFCGGHNQGVKAFLDSGAEFLLILNPDVKLDPLCIEKLRAALLSDTSAGAACAKLYRADNALDLVSPLTLDSAGMILTTSLRHFDRGSEQPDNFFTPEYIFGGTGACILLRRHAVNALLLEGVEHDALKLKVHPELSYKQEERSPLFDEAFFAYREDADLAWRMGLLGFRCIFVPEAFGNHKRVVLPTNRACLSVELNGYSVRNRFLLQLNNYFWSNSLASFFNGILLRNLMVVAGVLIRERSSLKYLLQVITLFPRAIERRGILTERIKTISKII